MNTHEAIKILRNTAWLGTNEDREKTEQAIEVVAEALEQEPCDDMGEVSDGYHTFNQLYHQRAVLFATIVNQNKDKSWKSFRHSDGNYCFDSNGEWFIVGIDTPQGSYTYHYSKEYWNMFDCEELEFGKEWDGHTEEDVTRLLSLEQEPSRATSEWIPTSERLPEKGPYVLASVNKDYAEYNTAYHEVIIYRYEEQPFWSNGIITAWQPLPDPYKESEE